MAARTRLNATLYAHCMYYTLYTLSDLHTTYAQKRMLRLLTELFLFEFNQNWNCRNMKKALQHQIPWHAGSAISVLSRGDTANAMGLLLRSAGKAPGNRILSTACVSASMNVYMYVRMYVCMYFERSPKKTMNTSHFPNAGESAWSDATTDLCTYINYTTHALQRP
jgi:hypothetical protein